MGRNTRVGKPVTNIGNDGSGRGFYPFDYFEDGVVLRYRARKEGSFGLQSLMFGFVSDNRFERSCDKELFLRLCAFKKQLKPILISTDVRLFELNIES